MIYLSDKEAFNKAMEKVINSYEHRGLRFNPINWIKDILTKIIEKIVKLIIDRRLLGIQSSESAKGVSIALISIATIIIILLGILVIYKMRKRKKGDIDIQSILGEEIDENTTYNTLKGKVKEYETQGEFRQAVRIMFIALIFKMHEEDMLTLEECKTSKEIYESLKKSNVKFIDEFKELSNMFNEVWYGYKINEERYSKWRVLGEKIENGVELYEKEKE
ncbi:hypothetical protein [Oceanirhabdus sp. W0125-5]|uniref:hypothetical protein n=1 Tax=Oceanirhabdus sp. W0125-5 TaxID=2999116 RepID=UPI0022F2C670|nr:hypothetical protein [Oceanirhabdus sp. W0125-5]WBW95977.1 hypothetical protein OW730_20125 [Oceanirhabdus sp. W0125-5]